MSTEQFGSLLCKLGTALNCGGFAMLGAAMFSFPAVGVPQWLVGLLRLAFFASFPAMACGVFLMLVGKLVRDKS